MAGIILVNGAGGFLGSWVVELLCSQGCEVRATDLPGADLEPARRAEAEVVEADLLDADAIPRLFDGVTRAINVAGLFNYSLPYRTLYQANVEVTRNMCEAALKAEVSRFVHISSIAVYGKPETSPMKEDHPINAKNNYERSKREGEDVVFDHVKKGLPAVSLRPAGIYGPRSRYGQAAFMALLAMVRSAGARRIPVMKGGPKMQHVHVTDVAGAVKAVLEAPEDKVMGRAVNVGDDSPLGQGDLFRALMPGLDMEELFTYPYHTRAFWPFIRALLALPDGAFSRMNDYFKKRWDKVVGEHDLKPALAPAMDRDFLGYMNADYALDNAFLKSLGYRLKYPDAGAGLSETIAWYQENQWLPAF
jgi:nucleoside-diphosphate-sugar epimerase